MDDNPSYEKLEIRICELEREIQRLRKIEKAFEKNEKKDCCLDSASAGNTEIKRGAGKRKPIEESLDAYLRQGEKMEAIGTLAGGIAHDFNNMLFPIVGYTEMTLADLPEESELHHNLREVLKSANRAAELVRKILKFSGRESNKLKPVKIQHVVEEALGKVSRSLPDAVGITGKIDRNCGAVMADPAMIHRMIMNLCNNACHAVAENGGNIEVTLSEVERGSGDPVVSSMMSGSFLLLTVRDSGKGMGFLERERIFEPYFITREKGRGTGLGLAVVYGIVKRIGGEIRVESALGEGACFSVYLPRVQNRSGFPIASAGGKLRRENERPIPLPTTAR